MNYVYKNIRTANAQIIIARSNSNAEYYVEDGIEIVEADTDSEFFSTVTIHKCDIANTHGLDATVDLYLETFNLDKTLKIYGSRENGNWDTDTTDYKDKSDLETYYKIKEVVVPAGTTLSLFTDHPCTHSSKFNFIVKTTHMVDVIVDYEFNYVAPVIEGGYTKPNITNQY